MIRLVVAGFAEAHMVEVIRRVCSAVPAEPVYWAAMPAHLDKVRKAFPGTLVHDALAAGFGIPAPGRRPEEDAPLDAPVLEAMAPFQLTALKMMERLDSDRRRFSFESRLRLYHRLLGYWLGVLRDYGPDVVVFPISPHSVWDYVLYGLCKTRGVPTLLLERTALPGRILIIDSIDNGFGEVEEAYQSAVCDSDGPLHRSPNVAAEQARLARRGADISPRSFQAKMRTFKISVGPDGGVGLAPAWRGLRNQSLSLAIRFLKGDLRAPIDTLPRDPQWPERGPLPMLRAEWARLRGQWLKLRLRRTYRRLQRHPDLSRPYVYVAIHYQPERNSLPVGGVFADQSLIVRLLAATVPEGWRVLVKEHIWQCQPFSIGERGREPRDYLDMVARGNVDLVPIEMASSALIDGAKAVATISGSVGWQAIHRGVPSLVFGAAWYQFAEGCWRIRSDADARQALERIQGGYRVDLDRLHRFAAAVEQVAVRGIIDPSLEDVEGLSPEQAAENLALALSKRISACVRPVRQDRTRLTGC